MLALHTPSCLSTEILRFPLFVLGWDSFPQGLVDCIVETASNIKIGILVLRFVSWAAFLPSERAVVQWTTTLQQGGFLQGFSSCVWLRCTKASHAGQGSWWELSLLSALLSLSSVSALQVCLCWCSVPAQMKHDFFYGMHLREGKVYSPLWCVHEFCFQMVLRSMGRTL